MPLLMHSHEQGHEFSRLLKRPGNLALVFFALSVVLLAVALGSGWLLTTLIPVSQATAPSVLPATFLVSTGLLAASSLMLFRAL